MGPRVTHCPVNVAGVPWQHVQCQRRRGLDARLVVFEPGSPLHPEADVCLHRPPGFIRAQLCQARAFVRLLPQTDVFHFYFGLTLVPKSIQFPLLHAARRRSVMHFLGSDIRGKPRSELAWAARAGARIVGSYDAIRWVPEAEVVPPGVDLRAYTPAPPADRKRPLVVHAPSNRQKKGTEHVIAACDRLDVDLRLVEGLHHAEARRLYAEADIVVDQVNAGWYGLLAIECMALGKPVLTYLHDEAVARSEEAFGMPVPIVRTTRGTIAASLAPLVESAQERRRVGAASRAWVERVHDIERTCDQLDAIYATTTS